MRRRRRSVKDWGHENLSFGLPWGLKRRTLVSKKRLYVFSLCWMKQRNDEDGNILRKIHDTTKRLFRVRVRNYGRWSDLGGKNICLVKWFNINLWPIFAFASFLTWSLNCNFYSNFYNTMCWSSGKDSGLSPRRPQFKSHSQQAFLQKDFPWKFFKKWLSPVWKLFEGYFEIHYS